MERDLSNQEAISMPMLTAICQQMAVWTLWIEGVFCAADLSFITGGRARRTGAAQLIGDAVDVWGAG